jgi:hypothetical protein
MENKSLREKLDSTSGGVSSFIREMNSLLDSHELQQIMLGGGGEGDSDDDEDHVVDYEEIRPHAGTGGSS